MVIFLDEALGVGHEAEGTARGILQAGDGEGGAVEIIGVGEGHVAVGEVGFGIAGEGDEAALGVGDGELELLGQTLQVGAGGIFHLQLGPAADEALGGIIDEAAGRENAEFGKNLETIADAESIATAGVVILDGVAEFRLGDELREATGHDVVTVAKAAGKHHELGFFNVGHSGIGDRDDGGGEADELESAGGFGIAVGAGVFEQGRVWHVTVRVDRQSVLVMAKSQGGNRVFLFFVLRGKCCGGVGAGPLIGGEDGR